MESISDKIKILIADPLHNDAISLLKSSGFSVTRNEKKPKRDLIKLLGSYHAIICRTATKIDKNFFIAAKNLKCIGLASTGYDHIDIEEASRRGVYVLGLPPENSKINVYKNGNFISTAEHTILLILAASRNFHQAVCGMREGRWEKNSLLGNEIHGKTLGIVGFGRIGKLVSQRALGLGMKILAHDPYLSREHASMHNAKLVSLTTLCKKADVITIHAPQTPQTIGLIDEKCFGLMTHGVIIINAARASIIDEDALLANIKNGKVKSAAVDVFKNEPLEELTELTALPNVFATPHIGGSTEEALRRISMDTAKNVTAYLKYGRKKNAINKIS